MSSALRKFRARDVRDLAEEQHGLITTAQLAWAGVPPATRRRWCLEDVLVRLTPRVYLVAELLDELETRFFQVLRAAGIRARSPAGEPGRAAGVEAVAMHLARRG